MRDCCEVPERLRMSKCQKRKRQPPIDWSRMAFAVSALLDGLALYICDFVRHMPSKKQKDYVENLKSARSALTHDLSATVSNAYVSVVVSYTSGVILHVYMGICGPYNVPCACMRCDIDMNEYIRHV